MKPFFTVLFFGFILLIGKYMRFIAFLILVFGAMWLWNYHTTEPEMNTPVAQPANAASAPAAHDPTLAESVSQWFVDHTPKK